MNRIEVRVIETAQGPFSIAVEGGRLVAAGFSSPRKLVKDRLQYRATEVEFVTASTGISREVSAYFDGDLTAIDRLVVEPQGSPFQVRIWRELRRIPAGKTLTYKQLAQRAGHPVAVRAAASACANNPVALVVPCHRVIRSDGSMGGYFYGVARKRWLLSHESTVGGNDGRG